MSESLVDTKRRIKSIQSTEKITKAMKMVAAARFQRWRIVYENNQAYRDTMRSTMITALQGANLEHISSIDCLKEYEGNKNLYIIVSSSLGLCGAYNFNIFKAADREITDNDEIIPIGQKAYFHYRDKKNVKYENYVDLVDGLTFDNARMLRHFIMRLYRTGEYGKVFLVYTHYKNSLFSEPTVRQLLPFSLTKWSEAISLEPSDNPPDFEPSAEEVLNLLLPHYIDSSLYKHLLESQLSEFSTRRNAMETATNSADKITKQLQIVYNKSRQNAITQEITEVVAGANAGKKDDDL
ncbi:MAG: ATP synthase F1 subunit gamma [Bacilli bacterium]